MTGSNPRVCQPAEPEASQQPAGPYNQSHIPRPARLCEDSSDHNQGESWFHSRNNKPGRTSTRCCSAAGWHVCDAAAANIHAARGVAIREFPLGTPSPRERGEGRGEGRPQGYGFADYLLYVDGQAAGVIEAKKEGVTLTGVETQSDKYTKGLPAGLPRWGNPLPFSYQSTGIETRFTNGLDPHPRSRPVFAFHKPETLAEWLAYLPSPASGRGAGGEGAAQVQTTPPPPSSPACNPCRRSRKKASGPRRSPRSTTSNNR